MFIKSSDGEGEGTIVSTFKCTCCAACSIHEVGIMHSSPSYPGQKKPQNAKVFLENAFYSGLWKVVEAIDGGLPLPLF